MKWEVIITTDSGKKIAMPLNGYYKTKKEAEQMAETAKTLKSVSETQIIKK